MKELAGEPVTLLMITDEEAEKIETFVEGFKMPGWVVVDEDESTLKTFDVKARPRTIVINPSGTWVLDIKPKELTAGLIRRVMAGEIRSEEAIHSEGTAHLVPPPLGPEALPPATFGEFELLSGTEGPIRIGHHGLAAPALFDHDGDGKKDLWVGEFEGRPSLVRVYRNEGTNKAPSFSGQWTYAQTLSGKHIFVDTW